MIDQTLFQTIDRFIRPIRSRLSSLIHRGIIHKSSEDGRILQVSFGEGDTQDNIRKGEHFGFSSVPPANSDSLVLFPAGSRTVGFSIASQSQKPCPIQLKEGESAQYNEDGSYVALRAGGKVQIKAGSNELITILHALIEEIESIKIIDTAMAGTYPLSVKTTKPAINLTDIKTKLDSMRVK